MNTIQNNKFEASVLALFNKAIKGQSVTFEDMQKKAFQKGYVVHPDCCTTSVEKFIDSLPSDYNTTFYKEWKDIESKSRWDIWMDQITSYIYAFGADTQYTPNEGSDQPQWKDLKVIEPISIEEAIDRAKGMLYAPLAMKQETIQHLLNIIDKSDIEVDKISNREAMLMVCASLRIIPTDPIEMLRFAVYKATGKTMLIKDRETITAIQNSRINLRKMFADFGIEKLSTIFFRFKKLFLAFKSTQENKHTINVLNRLAKKHHKPMQVGYWERLLSDPSCVKDLENRLSTVDNFKKVKLLTAINERGLQFGARFYTIRNGRIWVKEGSPSNLNYYKVVASMIRKSLVDSLKAKATTVFIPNGVNYTVPTSEKKFIGNFPIGTSFLFGGKNSVVGVHRNKENAIGYLDFSFISAAGEKVGWNESFKNDNLLFSGDVFGDQTKETTELVYAKNGVTKNYITAVNDWSNTSASRDIEFTAFLAIESMDIVKNNCMVDPNNIVFSLPLKVVKGSRQISFGVLTPNKFILSELKTGNSSVAGKSITNLYADYAAAMPDCYINLQDLLKESGFEFVDKKDAKIDLSVDTLSKDSILNILT